MPAAQPEQPEPRSVAYRCGQLAGVLVTAAIIGALLLAIVSIGAAVHDAIVNR